MQRTAIGICLIALGLAWGGTAQPRAQEPASNRDSQTASPAQQEPDRSPVDVALSPDGSLARHGQSNLR